MPTRSLQPMDIGGQNHIILAPFKLARSCMTYVAQSQAVTYFFA